MLIDTDSREQLHLVARGHCRQIILESRHVHLHVGGNVAAAPGWEQQVALRGINGRKRHWYEGILKVQWNSRQSRHQRLKDERKCAGEIILKPQIWKYCGDGAAGVQRSVLGEAVVHG